ncbi:MAG: hypothetical protein MJ250_06105 [Alphaproteobacteria bacterium]|nr:hypothetical protein [Alphaproteobacteria bacterium]
MTNKSENKVEKNIELNEEDLSTITGGTTYNLTKDFPSKDVVIDPKNFLQEIK